ncbi:MAG: nuclear transport factor 2 family protein [Thiobacillus sp.]|nr:nuclear transport factor 2 family protein [Thiobacillus sp.]
MNALDALCDYFERLDAGNLAELDAHYARDAWFKDPFHEVSGVEAIRTILKHTFAKLPGARFRVTRRFPGASQDAVILWEMDFVMPVTRQPTTIRGATHLEFDVGGRVTRHRDYWDAAEELYARLPVLKWLMRGLARQAAAPL